MNPLAEPLRALLAATTPAQLLALPASYAALQDARVAAEDALDDAGPHATPLHLTPADRAHAAAVSAHEDLIATTFRAARCFLPGLTATQWADRNPFGRDPV